MRMNQFRLSYEISPIILNGGLAAHVPGGMVPIISLIQPQDFRTGLLSQGGDTSFDNYVAHFAPMAGSTLKDNQFGTYPYGNSRIAANAIIFQGLRVSLMMIAPAPNSGGYVQKLAALTSLKSALDQHDLAGGTYTVATPGYIWTDCLLAGIRDVSGGDSAQVQTRWQWDFYQPLLTAAHAAAAQNSLMSKISAGAKVTGNPPSFSGTAAAVGVPASGVAPPLVPAAQSTSGSSVSGLSALGGL